MEKNSADIGLLETAASGSKRRRLVKSLSRFGELQLCDGAVMGKKRRNRAAEQTRSDSASARLSQSPFFPSPISLSAHINTFAHCGGVTIAATSRNKQNLARAWTP
jgi:hypothetical protein